MQDTVKIGLVSIFDRHPLAPDCRDSPMRTDSELAGEAARIFTGAPLRLPLPAAFTHQTGDRRELLSGQIDAQGRVQLCKQQGSAMLSSLVNADGLIELPPGKNIEVGQMVDFLPLSGLLS